MNTPIVPDTNDNTPAYNVTEITPELASEWLDRNTRNRNLRALVVNNYAADMAAGNWVEDGQSIKFSDTGVLLDGQHRLSAIVKSGVTIRMLVVSNLPEITQETMDTGAKRSLADVLKLRGEANYVALASIILKVHLWEAGQRKTMRGQRPTHRQLLQTFEAHPEIRRSAEIGDRVRSNIKLPGSVAGLCHWLFNDIDAGDCAFFFARLCDGIGLMDDDPVYALRRTIKNLGDDKNRRPQDEFLTAIVIKAWNAYRDGRSMHLVRFKPGGASPEAYPEPK